MPDASENDYTITPWVRVADADGNHMDRHHTDLGLADGTFTPVKGYALSAEPRPHVYRVDLKGEALDAELQAAGLSRGGSAAEKRDRLADHEAATAGVVPDDATTNGA